MTQLDTTLAAAVSEILTNYGVSAELKVYSRDFDVSTGENRVDLSTTSTVTISPPKIINETREVAGMAECYMASTVEGKGLIGATLVFGVEYTIAGVTTYYSGSSVVALKLVLKW